MLQFENIDISLLAAALLDYAFSLGSIASSMKSTSEPRDRETPIPSKDQAIRKTSEFTKLVRSPVVITLASCIFSKEVHVIF
ncbi:hypothetical protein V6N13_021533 [Hibiscus sabdariffa]|uniref:Uncharacterized protein n=2 Tax=Hibiscus sabdariffa TaxID=183260 RepID=A0ABR2NPC0_9ROSI